MDELVIPACPAGKSVTVTNAQCSRTPDYCNILEVVDEEVETKDSSDAAAKFRGRRSAICGSSELGPPLNF